MCLQLTKNFLINCAFVDMITVDSKHQSTVKERDANYENKLIWWFKNFSYTKINRKLSQGWLKNHTLQTTQTSIHLKTIQTRNSRGWCTKQITMVSSIWVKCWHVATNINLRSNATLILSPTIADKISEKEYLSKKTLRSCFKYHLLETRNKCQSYSTNDLIRKPTTIWWANGPALIRFKAQL